MLKLCVMLALVLFNIGIEEVLAAKKAKDKEEEIHNLTETMDKLGKTMKDFFPYLFSHKKFSDPQNKKIIDSKLATLIELFSRVSPHFEKGPLSYKISYMVMKDHLKTAKKVYREENKHFARTMLKSTAAICVSCHNQDKIQKGFFLDASRMDFASDYEYGEFNYMTRNYHKALRYFDQFLKDEALPLSEKDLYPALRKSLTIFTQIEKNPAAGIEFYEKFLNRKDLPALVKNDVRDWLTGLNEWKKHDELKISKLDWENLKPLAEKHLIPMSKGGAFNLNGKQHILYLRLAGMLYDFLHESPTREQVPHVLYWLAVCDRVLNYDFFFSLADLYLKECIIEYSDSDVAPKCYEEYKDYVDYAFSGSGNTDIPDDIKLELKTLKSKLKGKLI